MHSNGSATAEIETRALEIAAEFDRKIGPFRAEIVPNASPCWHILKTVPGQEDKAGKFLESRGFGLFIPRFIAGSRMVLHSADWATGRQRHELIDLSEKLLFPAKIFLFCWSILDHWRRILACPGVQQIMVDVDERPVVVRDEQINRIQLLQVELAVPKRKRRKRYRSADDRIVISTVSHWP